MMSVKLPQIDHPWPNLEGKKRGGRAILMVTGMTECLLTQVKNVSEKVSHLQHTDSSI